MKKIGLILLLIISIMSGAYAVTAYPGAIKFKQPNSETFVQIYLFGDERFNWGETLDGYSLVHSKDGSFVYATLDENGDMIASQYVATDINERPVVVKTFLENTPKHLRYSKTQRQMFRDIWAALNEQQPAIDKSMEKAASRPVTIGTVKFLAILVNFTNKTFVKTKANFEQLFNQVNYRNLTIKGSVHDFYYENSFGQMNVQFDVYGPYNLTHPIAYYGSSSGAGGSQAFGKEAVELAISNGVDMSQYDNNNDNIVDAVHIIFAGYGEEDTGTEECIWSHKANLSRTITSNNVNVTMYSCSPELRSGGAITNVGVICHELGHVFGAPDYYDTDNNGGSSGTSGYHGNGKWDIMSSGSWNGNISGNQPANHNPYTKCYIYGWATPKVFSTTAQTVVLEPANQDSTSFYKLPTTTNNEYYLIENRQQVGFDAALPSHGMIIYHVHAAFDPTSQSNNVSHPQKFYPVSAGSSARYPQSAISTYGVIDGAACPFPGSSNKKEFTDNSTPWAKSWAQDNTGKPITNITENTTTNTVSFTINGADINPANVVANGKNTTTVQLDWRPYGTYQTMIVYSTNGTFGTPHGTYTAGQSITGGGTVIYVGDTTTFDHTGLSSGRTYYYKLFSKIDTAWSTGVAASATTTTCNASAFPYTQAFSASTMPSCWKTESNNANVKWQIGAGNTTSPSSAHSASYNAYCKITNDDYIGAQAYLISEPIDLSTATNGAHLTFWYANPRYFANQDVLTVVYRTSAADTWKPVTYGTFSKPVASWTQVTLNLDELSNYYQVAFVATANEGKGICIDDIEIKAGRVAIETPTQNNPSIKLYPNPATNNVSFLIEGNEEQINYAIYDLSGRQVSNGTMQGGQIKVVSLKDFKAGMYFVKFANSAFNKTETLIVQ